MAAANKSRPEEPGSKTSARLTPCDTCGNVYDKAFEVMHQGGIYTFDCFECAAHRLAPRCAHCACTVLGHGMEQDGITFCCAHCARQEGVGDLRDREDHEGMGAPPR